MLDSKTASLYRGETRNAMKNVNLWKNGVVPYILDSSVGKTPNIATLAVLSAVFNNYCGVEVEVNICLGRY